MVDFANDQVAELAGMFGGVKEAEEGGNKYYLIPALALPEHCTPSEVDVLLCPTARDGYPSRLFLSAQVSGTSAQNWKTARILGRDWWAVSYKVHDGLRLAQLVPAHLTAFRTRA